MTHSVAFYTLGCKLNFSETSTISRQLEEKGFEKKGFQDGADMYVINTCSVTDNADKKCRKVVKEALKHNPEAYVVIVGCYAQLKPQEISEIPGVDMVLGAAEKFNLLEHLDELRKTDKAVVYNANIKETRDFVPGFSFGDRTRTFLKVQDGCNYFCTFCTIPLARGFSRSATIEETLKQAEEVAQTEVKEVVLTGVNIGDFGKPNREKFIDLVKALDGVEGIDRFRISSIEPNLLNNEIIEYVSNSRSFVPHFHIPLQSGNNKILKLMRRRYQRELYAERVSYIKDLMPNCCIGVDVIVGFPGETDEDFLDTYRFLNDLDISYLHVFPYSERANTKAIDMEGEVPQKTRQERADMLRILSEKKRRHFYEQHLGKTFTVLFEAEEQGGKMNGFTENYIKITSDYDPLLVNELVQVKLLQINTDMEVEVEILSTENYVH
ncbi:MAG: tRNA (N(6)-L-threonylcarbamoyladenosine(37)-C(2))-methylthiotransferase MtaB [Bacteroidetes bacterium]|nr:MAG: tRNA (N(6)-L-threonylcarbamoyladenosine(37)-C(2))-methylthiotransferase MtaB [Bacteroidota bacterium]